MKIIIFMIMIMIIEWIGACFLGASLKATMPNTRKKLLMIGTTLVMLSSFYLGILA